MLLFLIIPLAINAQIFRPVTAFPDPNLLRAGETAVTHKWEWRIGATMAIAEVNQNKVTKEWSQTSFSAVGPAFGYHDYIPTSETDPTPKVRYGASLGVAIGKTIYDPQLAEAKFILAINLWEYLKAGFTYTLNPPTDIAKGGFFIGGGVTF